MADTLSIHEYHARLKELAAAAKQKAAQTIIIPAANKLLANKRNTIQVEGEKTDGSQIGQYSTKPMYAIKEQFVKMSSFKPQGKAGKPKKGAKVPKSMYLPQGYKELRQVQGRPTDKINETYSGDTMAAYQLEATPNGAKIGFINERASKIRNGQEARFGKIFYAQKEELELYNKDVTEAAKEFTLKFLKGV
jgi:hypothetical protein